MTVSVPARHAIVQMAWVVDDLEDAARRWHQTTGIRPFLVNRHIPIREPLYRGAPGAVDFSTAIAQAGPVQIELVQQHDDAPSCYRDSVPKGSQAMHHVASAGHFGTARFCYVDCRPALGRMVEILEECAAIQNFFAAIARAAEEWDGDPAGLLREL